MQDGHSEHRHEGDIRHAEEAIKKGHGNEEREDRVLPNERQTFPYVLGGTTPCLARDRRNLETIHNDGHDDKSQPSQVEGHSCADPGNDTAGHRRHDDACPLPEARVQGHGAAYDLAVDQMGIERLTGWLVKGLNRTRAKGDDDDMPYVDDNEERERRQYEDKEGGKALSDYNQTALVPSVRKNPAEEVQTNGRHTVGKPNVAQGQRGTRELVDQPELTEP